MSSVFNPSVPLPRSAKFKLSVPSFLLDEFEEFLRSYIQKFKHQSITTQDFKDYLLSYFQDKVKTIQAFL